MNLKTIAVVLGTLLTLVSCQNTSKKEVQEAVVQEATTLSFQNKGHELVYNMVEKVPLFSSFLRGSIKTVIIMPIIIIVPNKIPKPENIPNKTLLSFVIYHEIQNHKKATDKIPPKDTIKV